MSLDKQKIEVSLPSSERPTDAIIRISSDDVIKPNDALEYKTPGDEPEEFDWNDDDEEFAANPPKRAPRSSRYNIVWAVLKALLILAFISAAVGLNVHFPRELNQLKFWFTWLAFMMVITVVTCWGVGIVPWVVHKLTLRLSPKKTERVMSQLEYFIAVIFYVKLFIVTAWAWLSYWVCALLLFQTIDAYNFILFKIMQCAFFGSLLLLIEKLLLQIIVTKFHRKAYKTRIKDNEYALWVLDRFKKVIQKYENSKLLGKLRKKMLRTETGIEEPSAGNDSRVHLNNFEGDMSPQPPTRTYTDSTVDSGKKRSSHIFNRIKSIPLGGKPSDLLTLNSGNIKYHKHDEDETTYQAKKLARKLFEALINDDAEDKDGHRTKPQNLEETGERTYLLPDDFFAYFDTEEEAQNAFKIFDRDGNGDISKKEIRSAVINIYRERKAIATALRDLSQCTGKLDNILLTIGFMVWFLIALSSFNVSLSGLLPFWSALLAMSFVFGQAAKDMFESVIFVFMVHPFDAGDRIYLNGTHMIVTEMGLLTTTFTRWDGVVIYHPNNQLANMNIENVRRSGNMSEAMTIAIDFYTPSLKIKEAQERMNEWVAKEAARDFTLGSFSLLFNNMIDTNKLELLVCFEHKSNWQNMGERFTRRTKLLFAFKQILEELNIKYYNVPQPVIPCSPPPYSLQSTPNSGNASHTTNPFASPPILGPAPASTSHQNRSGNQQPGPREDQTNAEQLHLYQQMMVQQHMAQVQQQRQNDDVSWLLGAAAGSSHLENEQR
ncbi:uncharacterized protein VTP21DRAFT_2201 [Calcarisporiella thermophila]|uniref:uncharacterized protein n=1 Tax=Calcarisporiella thermophila TaxID=911321 RepID=UPI003742B054